jgi:tRNA/rRNA methyltransferase
MSETALKNCRIVLVHTHYSGNLGSVARVMRNFGLSDLVLVAPYVKTADLEARRLARDGIGILDSARVVPELSDAVADCVFTFATSSLTAGIVRRGIIGTPAEALPELVATALRGPVALVFGPEPHGLSNAELARCHGMLHIPVSAEFSSLNLAQAVTICCYEYRKAWSAAANVQRPGPVLGPTIAPHADQERMFEHLREALTAVGYLYDEKSQTLMHGIRQLIGRALPSPQEVRLLHGLARQLLYVARTTPKQGTEEHRVEGS